MNYDYKDYKAKADWDAWISSLSAEEKAELDRRGLGDPLDEPTSTAARSRDAAELPAAQLLVAEDPEPEPVDSVAFKLAYALRVALETVEEARDPKYAATILRIAIGDTTVGRSNLVKQRGATKQAISKAVRKVQKRLGLECIGTAASRAALDAAKARAHTAEHARACRRFPKKAGA